MNLNYIKKILVLILVFMANTVHSQDYVWIIGGGPSLEDSQSQIELNVKWAINTITNQNSNAKIKIYFTDGNNPAPDVVNHLENNSNHKLFLPFDFIFGGTEPQIKQYYNHSIPNVSGTTKLENLEAALKKDFNDPQPGDNVLILYNGHGGMGKHDRSKNYLRLWDETRMTVDDFNKIISKINPQAHTRFIMTQCYSGAFGDVVFSNANKNTLDIKNNRCGFMAESYNKQSEGCSASIRISDYRDYTTYFFAALNGATRLNKPLNNNPDLNRDQKTSLYEAHLYSLENSYSTDLFRSTSEQYLEKWEPWYIRWLTMPKDAEKSVYYQLAYNIGKKNNIENGLLKNTNLLNNERRIRLNKFRKLRNEDANLKDKIKKLQDSIIKTLIASYPEIKSEYKKKFSKYDQKTLLTIKSIIEQHKDFQALPELINKKKSLVFPLLDAERKLTQIEKISRMFKLAKLDSYFKTFASAKTSRYYSSLLSCENSKL